MAVGCGLCQRVWLWQLGVVGCRRVWRLQMNVVGSHVYGGDSLMCLVLTCVAMVIGCDWYPCVWL